MLRRMGENIEVLCKLLERGIIVTQFSFERHVRQSTGLMRRYRDTPMSFADACLVRMSEIHEDAQIFTTDSDFAIYRRNGRQVIPLIMPR